MKKLLLLLILATIVNAGDPVKLPGKETLHGNLKKTGFGYFTEMTGILDCLADQTKSLSEIIAIVDASLRRFDDIKKEPALKVYMDMRRSDLVCAILEGNAQAIGEAKSLCAKNE